MIVLQGRRRGLQHPGDDRARGQTEGGDRVARSIREEHRGELEGEGESGLVCRADLYSHQHMPIGLFSVESIENKLLKYVSLAGLKDNCTCSIWLIGCL